MNQKSDSAVVFSAVLRPHRSAGPAGIRMLVTLLAVVWSVIGAVFVLVGAWPVVPFLGLEVLLLWGALVLSLRAGNAFEAISLTEQALTVRRVDHWGKQSTASFVPYWLQVNISVPPTRSTPLELRSHGRSFVIGTFLLPEERLQLAQTLRRELDRLTSARSRFVAPLQVMPSTSRIE